MIVGESWLGTTGLDEDCPLPTPFPAPALGIGTVQAIDAGWGHSAILGVDGTATLLGMPLDFRNTLKHINTRSGFPIMQQLMMALSRALFKEDSKPCRLTPPMGDADPFTAISCSIASSTAFVTRSGSLLMMGQNFHGQCGVGDAKTQMVYAPAPVRGFHDGERVTQVALGFEHSLALTDRGALYAWGRGDRGQLGHGDRGSYVSAVRVLGSRGAAEPSLLDLGVAKIAAGTSQSACIAADGTLWVWGKMQSLTVKTASSLGDVMDDQLTPRRVRFPGALEPPAAHAPGLHGALGAGGGGPSGGAWGPAVTHLTASQAHISCLTADGRLWMMGLRGRGRGFDDSAARRAAGRSATLAVSGAPIETAPLGAAAANTVSSDIPVPELFMQTEPMEVDLGPLQGRRVVKLRSSTHHSYAITSDGGVFRWGWAGVVLPVADTAGLRVVDAAFGFCHALLLVESGG